MTWKKTLGRVAFINCEPLFHGLDDTWKILPAPPSWLTGHLLRKDCIIAPIPAADYAQYHNELLLIPNIAISSKGEVGSVLLLGNCEIEKMKTIALPSDSATSVALLKYLLDLENYEPQYVEMGPDLESMLANCDGCLLIGDRALEAAKSNPELVRMDLGKEWKKSTNSPMVFGVFAARKDSPKKDVKIAYEALMERLEAFENDLDVRGEIIVSSMQKTNQSIDRLERYFGEVINRMDSEDMNGLTMFLSSACGLNESVELAW